MPALTYPFRFPNRFYDRSSWLIVPLAAVMTAAVFMIMISLDSLAGSFLGTMLLLVLFAPFLTFLSTPLLRVTGAFKYYSALFLTFGETPKRFEIHSGLGIDYLLFLRGVPPGKAMKQTVLGFYLQGLLNIAAKVETLPNPAAVKIVGTSWFFSDRSVERMGFTVSRGGWFHLVNLLFNFIELTILNSLTAGRVALPNVFRVKQASMNGQDLLAHRAYIQRLYERMATDRNRVFEVAPLLAGDQLMQGR